MIEEVKENILQILKESLKAIKVEDVKKLSDLSNHTIHSASSLQDDDSTTIAVLIYSLFKIFERSKYATYGDWPIFYKNCIENINNAINFLERNDIDNYEIAIGNIFNVIDKLETHLKKYIQEVIEKAKIHKASRVHEHGISVGRTSKLLGVTAWELMEYIGKTGIADVELSLTKGAKERLNIAREIFG